MMTAPTHAPRTPEPESRLGERFIAVSAVDQQRESVLRNLWPTRVSVIASVVLFPVLAWAVHTTTAHASGSVSSWALAAVTASLASVVIASYLKPVTRAVVGGSSCSRTAIVAIPMAAYLVATGSIAFALAILLVALFARAQGSSACPR
jgi:hypothetical protein